MSSGGDRTISPEILACLLQTVGADGMHGKAVSYVPDLARRLNLDEETIEAAATELAEEYDWVQFSNGEVEAPRKRAMEAAQEIRDEFWG